MERRKKERKAGRTKVGRNAADNCTVALGIKKSHRLAQKKIKKEEIVSGKCFDLGGV